MSLFCRCRRNQGFGGLDGRAKTKSHMGQELPTKGNECMEAEVCPDDIRAYMRGRTGKAAARGNFGECRPHLVGAMEKASRS